MNSTKKIMIVLGCLFASNQSNIVAMNLTPAPTMPSITPAPTMPSITHAPVVVAPSIATPAQQIIAPVTTTSSPAVIATIPTPTPSIAPTPTAIPAPTTTPMPQAPTMTEHQNTNDILKKLASINEKDSDNSNALKENSYGLLFNNFVNFKNYIIHNFTKTKFQELCNEFIDLIYPSESESHGIDFGTAIITPEVDTTPSTSEATETSEKTTDDATTEANTDKNQSHDEDVNQSHIESENSEPKAPSTDETQESSPSQESDNESSSAE